MVMRQKCQIEAAHSKIKEIFTYLKTSKLPYKPKIIPYGDAGVINLFLTPYTSKYADNILLVADIQIPLPSNNSYQSYAPSSKVPYLTIQYFLGKP